MAHSLGRPACSRTIELKAQQKAETMQDFEMYDYQLLDENLDEVLMYPFMVGWKPSNDPQRPFEIFGVYSCDNTTDHNLLADENPLVKPLAEAIKEQAELDEDFIAMLRAKHIAEAPSGSLAPPDVEPAIGAGEEVVAPPGPTHTIGQHEEESE